MIGAIIGDVIGSVYEWHNTKSEDFELFSRFTRYTDDTVLTAAIADAILNKKQDHIRLLNSYYSRKIYAAKVKQFARMYPDAGFGGRFEEWVKGNSNRPYRSYGNGSAMRVSPIGFAYHTLDEVLKEAKNSALITHNHREGIKGAQAVASAIFLARTGKSKDEIQMFISRTFKYNLRRSLADIRPNYKFDSSCQGSVPEAIIAFLESDNFMDAIRKAISLGGDSDTIACITGAIAHAFYKEVPSDIWGSVRLKLSSHIRGITDVFCMKYVLS
jgi:ADP-ribosylglycohydrolase